CQDESHFAGLVGSADCCRLSATTTRIGDSREGTAIVCDQSTVAHIRRLAPQENDMNTSTCTPSSGPAELGHAKQDSSFPVANPGGKAAGIGMFVFLLLGAA